MKPILQDNKLHRKYWILYISIFIICTCGIGVVLYVEYFKDEKIEIVFGITDSDSEEEDEYNDLKSEFVNIFDNKVEILQENLANIEKISDEYDIAITAYNYDESNEKYTVKVDVPYLNIRNENIRKYNQANKNKYNAKAKEILDGNVNEDMIYTVQYKVYVQNDIISVIIKNEIREGSKSQKVCYDTFNYNFIENKEVTIDELLKLKDITNKQAYTKVQNEIKKVQNQNESLAQQGYPTYNRDYTAEMYKIENTTEYFLGSDGMLYLIYAYGNIDYTNEKDIVIFK